MRKSFPVGLEAFRQMQTPFHLVIASVAKQSRMRGRLDCFTPFARTGYGRLDCFTPFARNRKNTTSCNNLKSPNHVVQYTFY
jgi:hypothetical protein